jgi:hypothetical protein
METCCLVRAKLPAFWFPGIFRALRAANIWDLPSLQVSSASQLRLVKAPDLRAEERSVRGNG